MDILDFEMHSSGNPVPWDIENGLDHKEHMSMLHVKRGDSAHWAARINRATHRITHISAGPVIRARDYCNEVTSLSSSSRSFDQCSILPEIMACHHLSNHYSRFSMALSLIFHLKTLSLGDRRDRETSGQCDGNF
jgi:hypothetical protein